ncbi:MAG TPA: DNA methyltransferase, partial [Massilibacterium sp.]|nr:DNA methyltransferase [Massilibacterium sp.]
MIKDEKVTEDYAIYNSDCMYVLPELDSESIDFSVYSPPFAGLYNYSSSENDFSNCDTKEQFLEQYEYLIEEIARVTKPGRITAVHCADVIEDSGTHLWDFPHEIIRLHEKYGFKYRNKITVWKEPLKVRMRTMVRSLMHKLIVEDSTECFPAMPDYILLFKKRGENEVPVTHPEGLTQYFGSQPMLPEMEEKYGSFEMLKKKYKDHDDPRTNKLSHIIWQRYASSVWDDIRIDNVLKYKEAKDEDDEKHVHPLQLDVIDRL